MTSDEWKSHIVLVCVICEKVILFTKIHEDWRVARTASQTVMQFISINFLNTRIIEDVIINLFLFTVCFSCCKIASWESFLINKSMMKMWQSYLTMRIFLTENLSLLESSISLVHCEVVKRTIKLDSDYVIQSVKVNSSSGAAAQVHSYLQSELL